MTHVEGVPEEVFGVHDVVNVAPGKPCIYEAAYSVGFPCPWWSVPEDEVSVVDGWPESGYGGDAVARVAAVVPVDTVPWDDVNVSENGLRALLSEHPELDGDYAGFIELDGVAEFTEYVESFLCFFCGGGCGPHTDPAFVLGDDDEWVPGCGVGVVAEDVPGAVSGVAVFEFPSEFLGDSGGFRVGIEGFVGGVVQSVAESIVNE